MEHGQSDQRFTNWGSLDYCTVSVALRVAEPYVARIVEDVPCTAPVVTVKVMLLAPAGKVAVDGT